MKSGYIYALCHPISEKVRYIGQTENIRERYRMHRNNNGSNQMLVRWIKELRSIDFEPMLKVLEEVDSVSSLDTRVKHWIDKYSSEDLLNNYDRPQPEMKMTSVKVEKNVYKAFRLKCIDENFNFQKLVNKSMHLFLEDDEFVNRLKTLSISGSSLRNTDSLGEKCAE